MLNCKTLAQHHASDYLDQQLPIRQHLGVRVHLMLCKNCRRFIDQLRLVRNVLRHRPPALAETEVETIAARLYSAHHEKNKSGTPL